MLWRALIPLLFCLSCGDPGIPNSAYGSPQDDGGQDTGLPQCTRATSCSAGGSCCGSLCCSQSQTCCNNSNGTTSCNTPSLVGDTCT